MTDRNVPPRAVTTRALIIGCDDYAGPDLGGAVADAREWLRLAREMGIPGAHITVLTRPALDASALPGDDEAADITFGDATFDAIIDAAQGLADRMDTRRAGKALVTFSGHGSWDAAEGATLVPADGVDDPTRRLSVRRLMAALERRAPATDVTLFIDACHAARPSREPRARRRGLPGAPVPSDARLVPGRRRGGDVIVCASLPQQLTHEIDIGGQTRGAFSWAVTTLLGRWGVRNPGVDPDFDLSLGTLLERAAALLDALALPQPPHFIGPDRALDRAVLASRLADAPDDIPDDVPAPREISPIIGWYQIKDALATVIGGVTVSASQMVWTWDLDEVTGPFPGESFELSKQSGSYTTPSNSVTETFENHSSLVSSSTTLTPNYAVTGSGTAYTFYMKYNSTSGIEWISETSGVLSGNTLFFSHWTGGSVTEDYYREDELL